MRASLGAYALATATAAFGFYDSHVPLNRSELATRVTLKRVSPNCGASMQPVRAGNVTVSASRVNSTLVFDGADARGKTWSFETFVSGLGCSLWSADLDRNGKQDLVLFYRTGAAAPEPPTGLTVVLFDAQGRPVPWDVTGYFEQDERGVKDLLDLNHDGRAELVQMRREGGYWITSVYEAKGSFWQRIDGSFGDREFPLYTRDGATPNHTATKPPAGKEPFEANLSNARPDPADPRKIVKVDYRRRPGVSPMESLDHLDPLTCCDSISLTFDDGSKCGPVRHPFTVVLESASGRKVAMLPGPMIPLLEEIARLKLPVVLSGELTKSGCSPQALWAEK